MITPEQRAEAIRRAGIVRFAAAMKRFGYEVRAYPGYNSNDPGDATIDIMLNGVRVAYADWHLNTLMGGHYGSASAQRDGEKDYIFCESHPPGFATHRIADGAVYRSRQKKLALAALLAAFAPDKS